MTLPAAGRAHGDDAAACRHTPPSPRPTPESRARMLRIAAVLLAFTLFTAACSGGTTPAGGPNGGTPGTGPSTAPSAVAPPLAAPAAICADPAPGPAAPPSGAVTVAPERRELSSKVDSSPPGTTFWLAPGTHNLADGEFSQVSPKAGDVFVGAPGAILDGRDSNRYAFTGDAPNVTIKNLTVRGFDAPNDEGVVNHDGADGWIIEDNVIENNRGAGMMSGVGQQVRRNCLRNNGQYGINAFKLGGRVSKLVVEDNEITGNNTDDTEARNPGCGCSGGIKFWDVDGADVRNNWVHDNRGVGLWADTNNNDFLVENNLIENNDDEGFVYEISYNLIFRGNTLRKNAMVKGKVFADRGDNFPVGAVYISESGGEPRIPARTSQIEIYGNSLENNWSGIVAWENADRFCNSVANTSSGYCTLLQPDVDKCAPPAIAREPLYSDCRWKTQRVDIHQNTFVDQPKELGCIPGQTPRMGVLSNVGTVPDWSPYRGDAIQKAITYGQDVKWRDNKYVGPWTFTLASPDQTVDFAQWQADPSTQDKGSTLENDDADGQGC
jgi:hypothetical protein